MRIVNRIVIVVGLFLFIIPYFISKFVMTDAYDETFVRLGQFLANFLPETVKEYDKYDYSIQSNWAAHPNQKDWADLVPPSSGLSDLQHLKKEVAVFYVYPSSYFGFSWNSPVTPSIFDFFGLFGNLVTAATGQVHASVFNSVGKVYMPKYRQMTGLGFMIVDNKGKREQALSIAYGDIEAAFAQFSKENENSPIIIAGHSQGAMLLCKLLKNKISNNTLQKDKLIVAYLVAADISDNDCGIPPCTTPTDLHCFVHYNIFLKGGDRKKFIVAPEHKNLTCVNPISFHLNEEIVTADENPGSRPFFRFYEVMHSLYQAVIHQNFDFNFMGPLEKGVFGAECKNGLVWVNNTEATGFWTTGVFPGKNLHGGESSLYYFSTRQNAELRSQTYFKNK